MTVTLRYRVPSIQEYVHLDLHIGTNRFLEEARFICAGKKKETLPLDQRVQYPLTTNSYLYLSYQPRLSYLANRTKNEIDRTSACSTNPNIFSKETAMGCPDISSKLVTSDYHQAFNRSLVLLINRGLNLLVHPEFLYRMTPGYYELKNAVSVIHGVSNTVSF